MRPALRCGPDLGPCCCTEPLAALHVAHLRQQLGRIDTVAIGLDEFCPMLRRQRSTVDELGRGLVGLVEEEGMGFDIKIGMEFDLEGESLRPGGIGRDDLFREVANSITLDRLFDRGLLLPQ